LLLPALGFLALYGNRFIPSLTDERNPETRILRVLTFNVLNRNTDFEGLAETILGTGADLVGLQELIPANAKSLEQSLRDEYPFHTQLPTEHKLHVGLFSRYPIVRADRLHLPWRDLSWETIVDVDGNHIKVIVVHLIPTLLREVSTAEWPAYISDRQTIRIKQVNLVLDAAVEGEGPVLVLCDCNLSEFSVAYARLNEALGDSYDEVGWGFGHTIHPVGQHVSYARIDYVWHSSHFKPLWARVGKPGLSDHNPVLVEFQLLMGP